MSTSKPEKPKQNSSQTLPMEDFGAETLVPDTPQTLSPSFKPAYKDEDFLLRDELRPVRLQLELLKPDLLQREAGITSTIVVFGSTRIPEPAKAQENLQQLESQLAESPDDSSLLRSVAIAKRICDKSKYYEICQELTRLITSNCQNKDVCNSVIITGGGGGIMEAANRGAFDAHECTGNTDLPYMGKQQERAVSSRPDTV